MAQRTLAEWREQYRRELVEIDEIRVADDPGARRHNRHVHRMQEAYLALRESAEGRAAISELIDDPIPTVAAWAATQALFWDAARARARLGPLIGVTAHCRRQNRSPERHFGTSAGALAERPTIGIGRALRPDLSRDGA